jgi:hypothetical protein
MRGASKFGLTIYISCEEKEKRKRKRGEGDREFKYREKRGGEEKKRRELA